jgi:potassium-transporting ATPase KdpC subunit
MKSLLASTVLFVSSVVLCCVLYPAALWAFGQGLFPSKANGSLVTRADGTGVGSTQIAQAFAKDGYFWPRPSAAGYNAAATGGSNWGAAQPKLRDRVAQLLGPLVRYKDGRPVGPDVEAWFNAEPDRAAKWAAAYPTSAAAWAKADMSGDEYGPNGKFVQDWAKARPDVLGDKKDAKPEEVLLAFFESYAKTHPGTFPVQNAEKKVVPAKTGAVIQALFFDTWLQDPANRQKVADIQPVPADFVTASGAGMDPHITLRNAHWQLDRVARARAGSGDAAAARKRVETILVVNQFAPLAGLAGEPLVNVVDVNLALDAAFRSR